MIDTGEMTGIRLIDRVEVPPELWAAMHSAAIKMDVGKGGVYGSRLNGPLRTVATPESSAEPGVSGVINVWGTSEDKPKHFPVAGEMTGKVNGTPCEYVGAWTPVGVNGERKYVVERDVKILPNPQQNGDGPEALKEASQEKAKEILKKAEELGLPVTPAIVWSPASSTIEWIIEKWGELKEAAVGELSEIDREALCPICEEWELKEENPVESFISHLEEDHDLEIAGGRAQHGDISVWSSGGTLTPVYRQI